MSERVKLTEPGSELVMLVRSVRPETVERNEYFLFDDGAKEMLVPQSSVKAQLERLELDSVDGLKGKAIKFSRSTKMSRAGKPYWNVDLASPEEAKAAGAASAAVPATGTPAGAAGAQPAVPPKSYTDLYIKATDFVIEKIIPKYKAAGLTLTGTDVKEMVACVFIPKSKE
jgi:hypothetical protein